MRYILGFLCACILGTPPVHSADLKYNFTDVNKEVDNFVKFPWQTLDPRLAAIKGVNLAVVRRGEGQIYKKAYGSTFDVGRASLVASATKALSAGLILSLVDEGKLELDRPVQEYSKRGPLGSSHPNAGVTMRHLLSMVSGVQGPEHKRLKEFQHDCIGRFAHGDTLEACGYEILEYESPDIKGPTSNFVYGGNHWQLAGAVAAAQSGKDSWNNWAVEKLNKCGLKNTYYGNVGPLKAYPYGHSTIDENGSVKIWITEKNGVDVNSIPKTKNPVIGSGAISTVGDLGKMLLMHLNGGACEQQRFMSPTRVTEALTDHVPQPSGSELVSPVADRRDVLLGFQDGSADTWEVKNYGMGWYRYEFKGAPPVFVAPGAWGSRLVLVPEEGWGAAIVMEATTHQGDVLLGKIFPHIRDAVLQGGPHLTIPAAEFNPLVARKPIFQEGQIKGPERLGSAYYDYVTSLHLPQGARIHRMRTWSKSASVSPIDIIRCTELAKCPDPIRIKFGTWPLKTEANALEALVEVESPHLVEVPDSLTKYVQNVVIDNATKSYGLKVSLPKYSSLSAVQLTYSEPIACHPLDQPAPHWGVKDGQCFASCGYLGTLGNFSAAKFDKPCSSPLLDAGTAYDVPFCCM